MTDRKFEKNIMTDFNTTKDEFGIYLYKFNEEKIKGTPIFVESCWIFPRKDKVVLEPAPHSHDFDEIIAFYGSDTENPKDLCGEIDFWMEDEKYTLTRSCNIFIPRGVVHCPMTINRVEKPIFHFLTGDAGKYAK
jgi:hypothetical protein